MAAPKKYTWEEKLEFVKKLDVMTAQEVAKLEDASIPTIYEWRKKVQALWVD